MNINDMYTVAGNIKHGETHPEMIMLRISERVKTLQGEKDIERKLAVKVAQYEMHKLCMEEQGFEWSDMFEERFGDYDELSILAVFNVLVYTVKQHLFTERMATEEILRLQEARDAMFLDFEELTDEEIQEIKEIAV